MKRIVNLWDQVGIGLIIKCATGVVYSNQACGHCCLRPEQEGAFVPIGDEIAMPSGDLLSKERELLAYFEGPPWHGSGAMTGLTEGDADFIDRVLTKRPDLSYIRVDRSKLSESYEAWVHVTVRDGDGPLVQTVDPKMGLVEVRLTTFSGFGAFPLAAILTWRNSD